MSTAAETTTFQPFEGYPSTSLKPSDAINSEHPIVRAFANQYARPGRSDRDNAISLYYAVRDKIRYQISNIGIRKKHFQASTTIKDESGWCVPKAVALAAACRAMGIPAKVGFADVKNHISTDKLSRRMGTDVFYWHGYTSMYLSGSWVKATPAFNIELCEKFRIKPLEFDGLQDSIYHPFDLDGNQHMEYLNFRGEFDDVPRYSMVSTFLKHYSLGVLRSVITPDFIQTRGS